MRILSFSNVFVFVFWGLLMLILGLIIGINFVVRIFLFILNCWVIIFLIFWWLVSFIMLCIFVLNMFCVIVFVSRVFRLIIGFIICILLFLVFSFLFIFKKGIICFFCYKKCVVDMFLIFLLSVFLNRIVFNMCLLLKGVLVIMWVCILWMRLNIFLFELYLDFLML